MGIILTTLLVLGAFLVCVLIAVVSLPWVLGGMRADLSWADLSWADLSSADLRWADLRWADLSSADLRWADLRWANLRWADLRWADLLWADLRSANLRSANLSWADLRSANLRWANLLWANLRLADLRSADLSWADLRSADLSSADLRSACLPSPTSLLLCRWNNISDELTTELMRYAAANHPDTEKFTEKFTLWANGGECPYTRGFSRCVNFQEKRNLWSPGESKSARELVLMLFAEKEIKYSDGI